MAEAASSAGAGLRPAVSFDDRPDRDASMESASCESFSSSETGSTDAYRFDKPVADRIQMDGLVCDDGRRYKLYGRLGKGGYGTVLEAMRDDGRPVACKVFEETSEHTASMLNQEVSLLRSLRHKHIVELLTVARWGRYVFLIMEFACGGSLRTLLSKVGHFSKRQAAAYISDVLAGLDYLHRHNVIHRDIKPENVLLTEEGRCKLADFGLARRLHVAAQPLTAPPADPSARSFRLIHATQPCGTPLYMAPELASGSTLSVTNKVADVWSVGIMLLEMVTGRHPWQPEPMSDLQVIYRLRHLEAPPAIPEALPPPLRDFLARCLTLNPLERAPVHQLRSHEFLSQLKLEPHSPLSVPSQASPCYSDSVDSDLGKLLDTIFAYEEDLFHIHGAECAELLALARSLEPHVVHLVVDCQYGEPLQQALTKALRLLMACCREAPTFERFDADQLCADLLDACATLASLQHLARSNVGPLADAEGAWLEAKGDYDAAESRYLQRLEAEPQSAPLCYALGRLAQCVRCDAGKARAWYSKALDLQPSHSLARTALGAMVLERDMAAAETQLTQALADAEGASSVALHHLGEVYRRRHRTLLALAQHCRLQSQPGRAADYQHQALQCDRIALEHFQQAVQLNPGDSHALAQLGGIFLGRSDFPAAEAMFRQAVVADQTNAVALTGYGWLHMQKKCYARAQQCFSDALLFAPTNSQALCGLGAVLIHMYRKDEAAEHYLRRAAEADPANDWVPVYQGILAQKWKKDYDRARQYYIQALDLNPRNSWALNNLGELAMLENDPFQALAFFEDALVAEPGHTYALANVQRARKEVEYSLA
eukprot:EG_transcript_3211